MTNKVILIRHGQSMGNIDSSMYKEPDSAICLTNVGVKQALHGANELMNLQNSYLQWKHHGMHAFVSEYTRAQQTARIYLDKMNFTNINPIITPGLNERHYGNNDKPNDIHYNPYAKCTNGESIVECRDRFGHWFVHHAEYLLSDGDLVLFCHGELMKAATSVLLNLDDKNMMKVKTPNAVPFIYEKDGTTYKPSIHTFTKYDDKVKEVIH